MVKGESYIPKLRFKGFSDEWTISKLKDLVINISGNDGRTNLPVLTISAGKGWMNQKDRFSQVIAGNELQNYTLLKKGQLSYNKGNSKLAKYGVVFVLKNYDEALVPRIYHSFQTKKGIHNLFIEYLFATKKTDKELAKLITSGARMDGLLNISNTAFMGINICRAISIQEQTQIGNFFQKIDQVIELQQKALDTARDYKKSMLQKMFPQKGEKVPQIRFDGFSGDWEEKKVGEISKTTFGGGTPNTKVLEYWKGDIPWIQSSDILIDNVLEFKPTKFINSEAVKNSATKIVPKNSLAIVTRVGVGKLALVEFEYTTSQDFLSLSYLKYDLLFSLYSLYILLQEEKNKTQGTAIKGITKVDFLSKNIFIPLRKEEQQKIGEFFQKLDQRIEQYEKKLESYQNLKKAMLQRLFV